jgi:flagellar biosynthesis component FlhA
VPHLKIIADFYSKMDGKEKRVVKGNPIIMIFSEILLPV